MLVAETDMVSLLMLLYTHLFESIKPTVALYFHDLSLLFEFWRLMNIRLVLLSYSYDLEILWDHLDEFGRMNSPSLETTCDCRSWVLSVERYIQIFREFEYISGVSRTTSGWDETVAVGYELVDILLSCFAFEPSCRFYLNSISI